MSEPLSGPPPAVAADVPKDGPAPSSSSAPAGRAAAATTVSPQYPRHPSKGVDFMMALRQGAPLTHKTAAERRTSPPPHVVPQTLTAPTSQEAAEKPPTAEVEAASPAPAVTTGDSAPLAVNNTAAPSADEDLPADLRDAICSQVGHYLSPQNLASDEFLSSRLNADRCAPLGLLMTFPRLREITSNAQLIIRALRSSPCFFLNTTTSAAAVGSETFVGLTGFATSSRSLVVSRIPASFTAEQIHALTNQKVEQSKRHEDPSKAAEFVSWTITLESDDACRFAMKDIYASAKLLDLVGVHCHYKVDFSGHGAPLHYSAMPYIPMARMGGGPAMNARMAALAASSKPPSALRQDGAFSPPLPGPIIMPGMVAPRMYPMAAVPGSPFDGMDPLSSVVASLVSRAASGPRGAIRSNGPDTVHRDDRRRGTQHHHGQGSAGRGGASGEVAATGRGGATVSRGEAHRRTHHHDPFAAKAAAGLLSAAPPLPGTETIPQGDASATQAGAPAPYAAALRKPRAKPADAPATLPTSESSAAASPAAASNVPAAVGEASSAEPASRFPDPIAPPPKKTKA